MRRCFRIGTLDESDRLAPDIHGFVSSKHPWIGIVTLTAVTARQSNTTASSRGGGPPEVALFAADFREDFVNMPCRARLWPSLPQPFGILPTELGRPPADSFVRDINAAFVKQIFDVTVAERETKVGPDGVLDTTGGKRCR